MKTYQTEFAQVLFGEKEDSLESCEKLIKKPITFGHQVHGAEILKIEHYNKSSLCLADSSDGLVTSKKGLALGLYTADCVPCVLATKDNLFSLHLGWRGIHKGLFKRAIQQIKPDDSLEVFIGPHIVSNSFEVQKEFIKNFEQDYPNSDLWLKKRGDQFFVSLIELIKFDLRSHHLNYTLFYEEVDTFKSKKHFSYRSDNQTKGRNLTISFLTGPVVNEG